jgi:hypothetical protein
MSSDRTPLEVFVSYAHADQALKDELLKHLSPLKRRGLIKHWHDREIDAGSEWAAEIETNLGKADIILLLISPDFLHSEFCYEKELAQALERHRSGTCRVIPVFLRACDWKGLPFGRLQGVPDDAIPVVSSQWPSQDDAFMRVAQGIRRVAENWQQGSAATPLQAPSEPTTSIPLKERKIEALPDVGSMTDSGAAVLLADAYFESDSVTELDDGRVEVRIAPLSPAEDALLRSLKDDRQFHGREVSFAHGNHGFTAQVASARSQSTAGRRIWIIELNPAETNQGHDDFSFNNLTPDQIATARAELLLLAKRPSGRLKDAESIIGSGNRRRGDEGMRPIFPILWKKSGGDIVKFLRWGRLAAIHTLIETKTCRHVVELALTIEPGPAVAVRFAGNRKSRYGSEVTTISVAGTCQLEKKSN